MTRDQIALLVVSCDRYSDLWEPFFRLFQKFWHDCPLSVSLLSNKKPAKIPGVRNILTGSDDSWSDSLRSGIAQVEQEYVFLFLDDLFLHEQVQTQEVEEVFEWIAKERPNYVRLNPTIGPDKPYNAIVGVVSPGTIYRTATVLSVWKKGVLEALLKKGESAWDFEIYGTLRSDRYDRFFSTHRDYFAIVNGVIKGKWQRAAVRELRRVGAELDLVARPEMTEWEEMRLFWQKRRSAMLRFVPPKYRRGVKRLIQGREYKYASYQ